MRIAFIFVLVIMLSTSVFAVDFTQGLVFALDCENNVNDSSGQHHAVGFTGAAYATGKMGNGCDLESGSGAFISMGDNDSFSFGDNSSTNHPYTWSFWVKPESNTGDAHYFSKRDRTQNIWWEYSFFADSTFQFTQRDTNTNGFVRFTNDALMPTIGQWTHIAIVYNVTGTTNLSVYVNGIKYNATEASGTFQWIDNTPQRLLIGAGDVSGSPERFYDGVIDEFYMWRGVAFNQSDIILLHNSNASCQYPFTNCTGAAQTNFTVTSGTVYFNVSLNGTTYESGGTGTVNIPVATSPAAIITIEASSAGYLNQTFANVNTGITTMQVNFSVIPSVEFVLNNTFNGSLFWTYNLSALYSNNATFTTSNSTGHTKFTGIGGVYSFNAYTIEYDGSFFNVTLPSINVSNATNLQNITLNATITRLFNMSVTSAYLNGTDWQTSKALPVFVRTTTPSFSWNIARNGSCALSRYNNHYPGMLANDSTALCAVTNNTLIVCTASTAEKLTAGIKNYYVACEENQSKVFMQTGALNISLDYLINATVKNGSGTAINNATVFGFKRNLFQGASLPLIAPVFDQFLAFNTTTNATGHFNLWVPQCGNYTVGAYTNYTSNVSTEALVTVVCN